MGQERLDIESRHISKEEQDFNAEIRRLELEISQTKTLIRQRREELLQDQKRQTERGLRTAEKPVTNEFIAKALKPSKDYIKRLQRQIIELKPKAADVSKAAQNQTSMF